MFGDSLTDTDSTRHTLALSVLPLKPRDCRDLLEENTRISCEAFDRASGCQYDLLGKLDGITELTVSKPTKLLASKVSELRQESY